MFINKSFTIAISNSTLIFNKDVVERLGDIPTKYFEITESDSSVIFTETATPDMNTIRVVHDVDNGTIKINSKDLVALIKKKLDITEDSFRISPKFSNNTNRDIERGVINNQFELSKKYVI